MERTKKRTQSLMTQMAADTFPVGLSANETKARAYSHHGHGPRADQTGRIHISDFRYPADILLRNAAGPYIWVNKRRKCLPELKSALPPHNGSQNWRREFLTIEVRYALRTGRNSLAARTSGIRQKETWGRWRENAFNIL